MGAPRREHRGVRACRRRTPSSCSSIATRYAEKQGLALSTETVLLTPSKALAEAIDFSLTKAAPSEVG